MTIQWSYLQNGFQRESAILALIGRFAAGNFVRPTPTSTHTVSGPGRGSLRRLEYLVHALGSADGSQAVTAVFVLGLPTAWHNFVGILPPINYVEVQWPGGSFVSQVC